MSLGTRLKAARSDKKLTQKELAALVGVTGSAIGNYEKSVSSPNEETLIRLMSVLDVDANYLYADDITTHSLIPDLSESEQRLFNIYHSLNPLGQDKLLEYARDLSENERYQKDTSEKAI